VTATATAMAMAMNGDDDADCTTRSRDPSVFQFSWVPPSMVRGSVRVVVVSRGLLYLFGGEVRTFGFWFDCWMIFFGVLIFWIDGFVLMVVVIGVCDLQIGTLLRYGCCFAVMVDY
jgi:hypothetical protein